MHSSPNTAGITRYNNTICISVYALVVRLLFALCIKAEGDQRATPNGCSFEESAHSHFCNCRAVEPPLTPQYFTPVST